MNTVDLDKPDDACLVLTALIWIIQHQPNDWTNEEIGKLEVIAIKMRSQMVPLS